MANVEIREATPTDIPAILSLLREFAEYEKRLDRVHIDEASLAAYLFREPPRAEVRLGCVDGVAASYALYFPVFASFSGQTWLYLEDLYVQSGARGTGVGFLLMSHLAQLTTERGWAGMAWDVLEWNTPALAFYEKLGAQRREHKVQMELSGDALRAIAGKLP